MRNLNKPYILIISAVITLLGMITLPLKTAAQREKNMDDIINELTIHYSNKIEAVLKKDMPRFNKMKSEAEAASNIKDNARKKKAMNDYSKANKQHYGNAVRDAGVDLSSLLVNLGKKFPDYLFTVSDEYSVLIEKKAGGNSIPEGFGRSANTNNNGFVFASGTHSFLSSPRDFYQNATVTSTIIALTFTKSKTIGCSLVSGGNVEFRTNSAKSSTVGVVAGGCTADGDLINSTQLPATGVTSIKLKMNFTLEANGYAVGVLGSSFTGSSSSGKAKIDGQDSYIINESVSKFAFAPALWVASFSQSKSFTFNPDLTSWKGKTLKITGGSHSSSISAICCATHSSGKISITSASLTITN